MSFNRKSCKELYDVLKGPLFTVCKRYTKSVTEAEDVLQDGFIKIFRDLKQYNPDKGSFYTWARRVVINTALENIRKKERRPILNELEEKTNNASIEPDVISHLNRNEILKHINELPIGYRTVFNLYIMDGYSHKEVAAQLGISENTSKTQLLKARKRLKSKLQPDHLKSPDNA